MGLSDDALIEIIPSLIHAGCDFVVETMEAPRQVTPKPKEAKALPQPRNFRPTDGRTVTSTIRDCVQEKPKTRQELADAVSAAGFKTSSLYPALSDAIKAGAIRKLPSGHYTLPETQIEH